MRTSNGSNGHADEHPVNPADVKPAPIRTAFQHFAEATSNVVGSYWAFVVASCLVITWAVTGPYFGYSDSWQLVINTGTTIVTFLMVFIIQNAQNRTARVVELKLNELLRGTAGARTGFVDLDHMSDDELECVREEFVRLRERFAPLLEDDIGHIDRELNARRKRH